MSNVVEYESDGGVNEYTLEDFIDPGKVDLNEGMPNKIVVTPLRVATWMDVLQPDGKPPEPSPWGAPVLPLAERKALGKLGEETNELGTVLFRIHLQGLDEQVPGETKTNRQWLEEELADVMATAALAVKKLNLDLEFITERAKKKTTYLEKWYMLPDIDPEGHKQ